MVDPMRPGVGCIILDVRCCVSSHVINVMCHRTKYPSCPITEPFAYDQLMTARARFLISTAIVEPNVNPLPEDTAHARSMTVKKKLPYSVLR